jgi:hypothetical protein
MSILETALLAGKEVVELIADTGSRRNPAVRAYQLSAFHDRLDRVLDPEKAGFNKALQNRQVSDSLQLQRTSDQIKQMILSDGELAGFLSANGGYSGSFTIDHENGTYVLRGASGSSYTVPYNSNLKSEVEFLYHAQRVLDVSERHPGLSLDQTIDLAFADNSRDATRRAVTIA